MTTKKRQSGRSSSNWARILEAIDPQHRFFALVALIVGFCVFAIVAKTTGVAQALFFGASLFVLILLVAIVTAFAISDRRPAAPRIPLNENLLDLLQQIQTAPGVPADYEEELKRRSHPAEGGWHRASVYGCLLLERLGLIKIVGQKIQISREGQALLQLHISSLRAGNNTRSPRLVAPEGALPPEQDIRT